MHIPSVLPLALGIIIFSFFITSIFVVPFIDLLYKINFTRRREGVTRNKSLFDKLHDKKAGTPIGGGILILSIVSILFLIIFPLLYKVGVVVESSFNLGNELFIIFFSFLSFGLLGVLDDFVKIFGKVQGPGSSAFGLTRNQKFIIQWILGFIIGFLLYNKLGISYIYVPIIKLTFHMGLLFIPFAAFVIVFFANAFNFTDGLDGLASGLLVIYLIAYIVIAATNLDTPVFLFVALWIGSLLSFLYFNIWPARIFLGDTGSLAFGSTIAVVGLLVGNVPTLFVVGGIFVIEAASSAIQIIGIKFFKRKIFPLAPIHHTFLAIGWEEPKIVMRAWIAGIVLAIFGLWLALI